MTTTARTTTATTNTTAATATATSGVSCAHTARQITLCRHDIAAKEGFVTTQMARLHELQQDPQADAEKIRAIRENIDRLEQELPQDREDLDALEADYRMRCRS